MHLEDEVLFFNPTGFYKKLAEDFQTYLKQLRSDKKVDEGIQNNFRKRFNYLFREEFRPEESPHW